MAETVPKATVPLEKLPYRPIDPQKYSPGIGLIGCGGITRHHLQAYRQAGYRVVALCDVDIQRAQERRDKFYPQARIYAHADELLAQGDVEVVDIATHPAERVPVIESALRAKKHVLSQKPFVLDLDVGRRLVQLAEQHGVLLAVNQNARWAPQFSYTRVAVQRGVLGHVSSAQFAVHWDHTWVAGTPFEKINDLILYDYAIHWFDMVNCLFAGRKCERIFASTSPTPTQRIKPPLLAQVVFEFERGQASLVFAADTPHGHLDHLYVSGSQGSIVANGYPDRVNILSLMTEKGVTRPQLLGSWFNDGFHGAMGELLCAIEQGRQPEISAADNLASLAYCFAAVESARVHQPVVPGAVRRLSAAVE